MKGLFHVLFRLLCVVFFSCLRSLLILSKLSPPIDQICAVRTILLPKPSPGVSSLFSRTFNRHLADSIQKKTSSLLAKSMQGATPHSCLSIQEPNNIQGGWAEKRRPTRQDVFLFLSRRLLPSPPSRQFIFWAQKHQKSRSVALRPWRRPSLARLGSRKCFGRSICRYATRCGTSLL